MFDQKRIGFIGGGNMGEALMKGMLAGGLFTPDRMSVCDVSAERLRVLSDSYGIETTSDIAATAGKSDIVLLAVKPQTMPAVLAELARGITGAPMVRMVVSIAAGIPVATLEGGLPTGTPVIRVMPNTPALVLAGAAALARGSSAMTDHMDQALALFRSVGTAIEVEEKLMDAVTGLSGSGPAYVLLFIESLIDAGVLMGLPRPVARELAIQTVEGTAKMARETGRHPAELKDMITSPAGTTIRGLLALEENSFRGTIINAVEDATLRSAELGKR